MGNAWWMDTEGVTTAAIDAAKRFAAKEAALDALIEAGPGGGVNYIHHQTTLLTASQIRALPTSGFSFGTPPGVGKIAFLEGVFWHLNWVDDFANIGATASLRLRLSGTSFTTVKISESLNQMSQFLAGGGSDGVNAYTPANLLGAVIPVSQVVLFGQFPEYDSDISNKSFQVLAENDAGADFTEGSTSTLRITPIYKVWDYSTGSLVQS